MAASSETTINYQDCHQILVIYRVSFHCFCHMRMYACASWMRVYGRNVDCYQRAIIRSWHCSIELKSGTVRIVIRRFLPPTLSSIRSHTKNIHYQQEVPQLWALHKSTWIRRALAKLATSDMPEEKTSKLARKKEFWFYLIWDTLCISRILHWKSLNHSFHLYLAT